MRFIILIVALLGRSYCFSQGMDTIKITNNIPIKQGYVLSSKKSPTSYYLNPTDGIIIYNDDISLDSVFSITNGKILHVKEIDGELMCTIKDSNFFYTYSALKGCNLKQGMYIQRGDIIGQMSNEDGSKNYIHIIISKRGKILSTDKHIEILNTTSR